MNNNLLSDLNTEQEKAVSAPLGNLLVLAGAGSGKTRVLTRRICWLIEKEKVALDQILALTFTNKAAKEMQQRIVQSLNKENADHSNNRNIWVGTFHSICHRLLRIHHKECHLSKNFQILDSSDQTSLLKKIIKEQNLDPKIYDPKDLINFISRRKDEGQRPTAVYHFSKTDPHKIKIYDLYQTICDRSNYVDFGEILLRCYELLKNNAEILSFYQNKFKHILIDEFQDTNKIQYSLIKLLFGKENDVMAVGDDDQSIYSWRGALVSNMNRFIKDFHNVKVIKLEQNYRSTQNIIEAANALISKNSNRIGKNLWTADDKGKPIDIFCALNEFDEMNFVTNEIKAWVNAGNNLNDCAVLYRANFLSRLLEKQLITEKINYEIYGGLRFFERSEIKDALSYLRLVLDFNDNNALERIINTPPRGIGEVTLNKMREIATKDEISLWQAIKILIEDNLVGAGTKSNLLKFTKLIDELNNLSTKIPLWELVEFMLEQTGLIAMYSKNLEQNNNEERIENLKELLVAIKQFATKEENQETEVSSLDLLSDFLADASLQADTNQEQNTQAVQLMTLHAVKGLEFKRVFIIGMENSIFPSEHAIDAMDLNQLEEERRLAYVGITRAREHLTLSYAKERARYGAKSRTQMRSLFLNELPKENINELRPNIKLSQAGNLLNRTTNYQSTATIERKIGSWQKGQKVKHDKFGIGTIINIIGDNEINAKLEIRFHTSGIKTLVARIANLKIVH